MKTLADIQKEIREILPQGIDLTFQALKNIIPDGTDKYKDLLLLESRYMDTSRQLLQGIISNEDAQLEFNRIRKDILDFIDSLQESHLKAESGTGDGRPDVYNGEVMYRIPKKMTQNDEVKCIVRLAFDRKVLTEDLEIEHGDVLKDIRISEVMGVELIDTGGKAFEIRTINDAVQFVEKDLYTEWIFFVKPLLPGTHPLILKISIIEIKDGVERKRNVVLEEKVEILTTQPIGEEAVEFASAGYALHLASGQGATTELPGAAKGVEPAPPPPSPSPAPAPRPATPVPPRPGGNFRKMASALAGLLVLLIASWAIISSLSERQLNPIPGGISNIEKDWQDARQKNTRESYEDFVKSNPDAELAAAARAKLDSIETATWQAALASNDLAAFQAYLRAYPDGRYTSDAAAAIAAIEDSNDEGLVAEPTIPDEQRPAKPQTEKKRPNQTKKTDSSKPVGPEKKPEKQPEKQPEKPAPQPPVTDEDPEKPVPMLSAGRLPVHQGCENTDRKKEEACTEQKILKHIRRFLEYPEAAKRKKIEGIVRVEFVVERDGRITDVHAVNDIGGGCAQEAVRIVKKLVPFKPGLNREGKAVRILYVVPIQFKLN